MASVINWGVRQVVTALQGDDRLKAETNLKPIYHYGLLSDAQDALAAIQKLPDTATQGTVRSAYHRARTSLETLFTAFSPKSFPDPKQFLTALSSGSAVTIKERAQQLCLSLAQVTQKEFPAISMLEKTAISVLDSASKTLTQLFSPQALVEPVSHYLSICNVQAALADILSLKEAAPREDFQSAQDRCRSLITDLLERIKDPELAEKASSYLTATQSASKAQAQLFSTFLSKFSSAKYPALSLIKKMSDDAINSVVNTSMSVLEKMNLPLKGLTVLEPFKTISPLRGISPEMVKQKCDSICEWACAFASMKCVNAAFTFQEGTPPLQFYQEIDTSSQYGGFCKWVAKQLYNLVHLILAPPLKRLFSRVYAAFTSWLQKDTESRVLDVLHWLEEWLSSVSEGYSQIAQMPSDQWGGRRIPDLLDANIRAKLPGNKELNLKQLCSALVSTGLDLFCIDWTDRIEQSCIPWPLKKIIQLFLYLPERLFNAILRIIGHFVLIRCIGIPAILERHIRTPSTSTPATPLTVQIKKWGYQKVGAMVDHVDKRLKNPRAQISSKIEKDMHACLQVLLEVLHKSNYPTAEKLRDYINRELTFKDRAIREFEEGGLTAAMPVVALGLGSALEKALDQSELLGTAYDLLSMCDETFVLHPLEHAPTDDIDRLIEALLERTARYGLNNGLAQRIAMTQATGFVSAIKLAFGERAYLRSLLYKAMTTSLQICTDTSQPQPT